jgi:uncharacterized PurR-regulated membrane protein YhhQ (DUF165 family)
MIEGFARILFAAFAAAFVAGPIAMWPIMIGIIKDKMNHETTLNPFGLWFMASLVAFLYATVLGLPVYFLLKKFDLVKWWTAMLAGFFIGMSDKIIMMTYGVDFNALDFEILLGFARSYGLGGMAGGLVAWLILRQQPDKNLKTE